MKLDEKSVMTYVVLNALPAGFPTMPFCTHSLTCSLGEQSLCLDAFTRTAPETAPLLEVTQDLLSKAAQDSDNTRDEELLFSIDAGVSCIKDLVRKGALSNNDKGRGIRKGLRQVKELRGRLLVAESPDEARDTKAELKEKYEEQVEAVTSDSQYQRTMKDQAKHWRRKERDQDEAEAVEQWESYLLHKLENAPKSPPVDVSNNPKVR